MPFIDRFRSCALVRVTGTFSCIPTGVCVHARCLGRSSGAVQRWRLEAWLGGTKGLEAKVGGHMGWEEPNNGTGECNSRTLE